MTGTNAMPGCGANWRPLPARSPTQAKADMMSRTGRLPNSFRLAAVIASVLSLSLLPCARAFAAEASDIEQGLTVTIGGAEKQVTLAEAMAALNIPSASIALID